MKRNNKNMIEKKNKGKKIRKAKRYVIYITYVYTYKYIDAEIRL